MRWQKKVIAKIKALVIWSSNNFDQSVFIVQQVDERGIFCMQTGEIKLASYQNAGCLPPTLRCVAPIEMGWTPNNVISMFCAWRFYVWLINYCLTGDTYWRSMVFYFYVSVIWECMYFGEPSKSFDPLCGKRFEKEGIWDESIRINTG